MTVAVISLRNQAGAPKHIYTDGLAISAKNINGYLVDGSNVFIGRRPRPLGAKRPEMVFGSMPRASGLVLNAKERQAMVANDDRAAEFIKSYVGTKEHIDGLDRFCLWIEDGRVAEASAIPSIAERLARVAAERGESDASSTAAFAARPHRFV